MFLTFPTRLKFLDIVPTSLCIFIDDFHTRPLVPPQNRHSSFTLSSDGSTGYEFSKQDARYRVPRPLWFIDHLYSTSSRLPPIFQERFSVIEPSLAAPWPRIIPLPLIQLYSMFPIIRPFSGSSFHHPISILYLYSHQSSTPAFWISPTCTPKLTPYLTDGS